METIQGRRERASPLADLARFGESKRPSELSCTSPFGLGADVWSGPASRRDEGFSGKGFGQSGVSMIPSQIRKKKEIVPAHI